MTLITNYFDKEKIIITADKKRTPRNELPDNKGVKLYKYGNYIIGFCGYPWINEYNFLLTTNTFMLEYKKLNPDELLGKMLIELIPMYCKMWEELLPLIQKMNYEEDPIVWGKTNLTISGVYSNELFSYYYQFKDNKLVNCMDEDKYNIRFNDKNSLDSELFSKSFEYINEKLFELKIIKSQAEINYNLLGYKKEQIIEALKSMYTQHEANSTFNVGGGLDYCIIYKTGEIEQCIKPIR